jgi:hypothetical protein
MITQTVKNYLTNRIELFLDKEVTDQLIYSNGILFHAIPNEEVSMNWNQDMDVTNAIECYSLGDIQYLTNDDNRIGISDNSYTELTKEGNIEVFIPRVVKQTPINFPPKIRYVQVEQVIKTFTNFIKALKTLIEDNSDIEESFTVYITLIGIKGVVFNATEREYTTTLKFPDDTLAFQINNPIVKSEEDLRESVEEAIHKTLYEFEPIA